MILVADSIDRWPVGGKNPSGTEWPDQAVVEETEIEADIDGEELAFRFLLPRGKGHSVYQFTIDYNLEDVVDLMASVMGPEATFILSQLAAQHAGIKRRRRKPTIAQQTILDQLNKSPFAWVGITKPGKFFICCPGKSNNLLGSAISKVTALALGRRGYLEYRELPDEKIAEFRRRYDKQTAKSREQFHDTWFGTTKHQILSVPKRGLELV